MATTTLATVIDTMRRGPSEVGSVYGRLTIVEDWLKIGEKRACRVRCKCGNERVVRLIQMKRGGALSCGCARIESLRRVHDDNRTHGMSHSPTWDSWQQMVRRCTKPQAANYHNYGGRGIRVCERWLRFENFLEDMDEKPDGLTLDRIDNDGNYEPGNCRWTTVAVQGRNRRGTKLSESTADEIRRRRAGGERPSLLAAEYGVTPSAITSVTTGKTWR